MATRPVLRIFISSTAIDLCDYRDKVRDAVLRLENLPIAMETFSAQSGQPASECIRMATDADAVICVVAHRYGFVPPEDLGGDGERSITWLEVDAAKRAGKAVFVFLVDPGAPWTQVKEQDRLTSEPPEKAPEIVKAVQKLQGFKVYLEREFTRNTFSNADELAKLVTASLANFAPQPGQGAVSVTRVWEPLYCYALQPAPHFRGREARLQELKTWLESSVTPDRVISIVAAGGTGKTALVEKALREAKLSDRAGVFVWSFYEDPHTDAFLRAAFLYFTGEKETPTGGLLERLQIALSGDAPHVLVLDGLERVQSEGEPKRRGELEDLQLKRLLRSLAGAGNTRALVTSRFPLVDLESFTGAGHRAITLDDLERSVAIDVLRGWKVAGDDAALARVLEPLAINGFYHALSVAVLGSYIGNFAGGDPNKAPNFSLKEAEEADPKAGKLSRILEQYATALTQVERDLIARLSVFPRGVRVECLGWIVQAGGEVAGALVGLADYKLVNLLERLRALGLVFRYETNQESVYSAHPFLREFFRRLLAGTPESVHESVRAKLAPGLQQRHEASDPKILDQYELLIEETLLAGRVEEAFDLYRYGMGGFEHVGWVLGEYVRGLRILGRFVPQNDSCGLDSKLRTRQRILLVNNLGLYASELGDLALARNAFCHARQMDAGERDRDNESIDLVNLGNVELHAGCFFRAEHYCEEAVSLLEGEEDTEYTTRSLALRAASRFFLGKTIAGGADFQRANELTGGLLISKWGLYDTEHKLRLGDLARARAQALSCLDFATKRGYSIDVCRCNAVLARVFIHDDPARANRHLQDARALANRSGGVELQLRCFHAACELHALLADYDQAVTEAGVGIRLADDCGFGKHSIDLRIALAESLLAAGDARRALQNAREALDRSEQPACGYAWGKADGLHFCGVAHLRLGEGELARQRLMAALELRQKLGHGRVAETHWALDLCAV